MVYSSWVIHGGCLHVQNFIRFQILSMHKQTHAQEYDKDGQPIGDGVNELPDRFCDEVRYGNDPYNKYFKEVRRRRVFVVMIIFLLLIGFNNL